MKPNLNPKQIKTFVISKSTYRRKRAFYQKTEMVVFHFRDNKGVLRSKTKHRIVR